MQILAQTTTERNESYRSQQQEAAAISAFNRTNKANAARQDRIEAMLAKTAAESPEYAGDILWIV